MAQRGAILRLSTATTLRLNLDPARITVDPCISDYPAHVIHPDQGCSDLLTNQLGTVRICNMRHTVGVNRSRAE